ncbi:MAG: VWA domain-containing protein [Planctomycetota bacterium]|jgi:hypothetical protein
MLVACLLLLADVADEPFLGRRLELLQEVYREHARRQSPEAIAMRVGVVREIGHLDWSGAPRDASAAFLAAVVANDRAYRVRADAIRAIGRVGTRTALDGMYRAVFGRSGRSPRYALLHSVIPESLAGLEDSGDWVWIDREILVPGRARAQKGLLHHAAHRADKMIAVTLEAAGRARRHELAESVRPYASHADESIRAAAVRALGRMRKGEDLVIAGLRDEDEGVRMAAASAESLPWVQLRACLRNRSVPVRRCAIRNLRRRPADLAYEQLIGVIANEPTYRGKLDAFSILVERTGEDFGFDSDRWSGWFRARRGRKPGTTTAETKRFQAGSVLFVVDVSASMGKLGVDGRTHQQQAVEAMRRLIGRTNRSTRFAAIGFASEVRRIPERGIAVSRPSDVLIWLGSLKPAGASNSYAALMQALQDPLKPDTIIFISDGVPRHCSWRGNTYSQPEQILHEVREANHKPMIRIHTIGLMGGIPRGDDLLDEETAEGFLRRLATDNGGRYTQIR